MKKYSSERVLVVVMVVIVVLLISFCDSSFCFTEVKIDLKKKAVNTVHSYDSVVCSYDDEESLNKIRFDYLSNFDYGDNEYIRALRWYIDNFKNGKVKDEILQAYKKDVGGKFVVFDAYEFDHGGLIIYFFFANKPENVFVAWVYSDVDIEKKTVTSYYVMAIERDENLKIPKDVFDEKLINLELKFW